MEFSYFILLFIGIFFFVLYLSYLNFQRIRENFKSLANHLFLDYHPPKHNFTYPYIDGNKDDRYVKIRVYVRGSGKNKKIFTEVSAYCDNYSGNSLKIFKEHVFSGISKTLGFQDIEIKDTFFDNKFIIRSNDVNFPVFMLNSDIKNRLEFAHTRMRGRLQLKQHKVIYTIPGDNSPSKNNDHIIEMVEVVIAIAKQGEAPYDN